MKHTPGPWESRDVPSAGLQIWGVTSFNGSTPQPLQLYEVPIRPTFMMNEKTGQVGAHLAYERWVQFETDDWREMQKANARLMAASPDLLVVLKEIEADAELRDLLIEPDEGSENSTLGRVRAAIAKAEGA